MILLEPKFVNKEIRIIFGTREEKTDNLKDSILNYLQILADQTGIKKFALMHQIHGTTIKEIKNIRFKKYKKISYHFEENTDSIWTNKNDVALCIKTADCMPVFIVTEELIAAIHMGWRGARDRIVEKFIKDILLNKNIKSESIKIICGPHIRECCYSVGKDLIEEFEKNYYKTKTLFLRRKKKIFLNLEEALYQQAASCGILNANITNMKLCTHCLNSIFYSYRRGDSGRNISLIIKGNRLCNM